ncbi:PREDICTED: GDSL esterase/lipase EXL3-like [Nelumbo nucifera]|uniref:GDSL esterase/lipase EXL3-like n=1 Tax=Nelumbo nucifera TaxID=4432 RepID=A0A1U8ASE9_NELNU|nr:PREDICTED: GDSL esterase/lipase EXL3-like [Nelumbo nucifera]
MKPVTLELGLASLSTYLAVLFSVFICFQFQIIQAGFVLPNNNVSVPALLVFGDSYVDTGNNNYLATVAKSNFPPYGEDFPGGKPTGRFSNGRVLSDLIAEGLGIKELVQPYLDPNLQIQDLLTGVNFGSAGAGFDTVTPKVLSVLTMSNELELFHEYIDKLKAAVGEERTATILSESIYIVCAGTNDVSGYFLTDFRKKNYDVPAYTDLIVQLISGFINELYELGARKIAVLNTPPVGCVPFQRTLGGGKNRECAEKFNFAARLLNSKLSSLLNSLNHKLPEIRLVYIDFYSSLLDIIQRPHNYGFEEVKKGCCGTGTIEQGILCNELNPRTCTDVSKYVFWDSYHFTERTNKALFTAFRQNLVNNLF